jgi:hypothetical protein
MMLSSIAASTTRRLPMVDGFVDSAKVIVSASCADAEFGPVARQGLRHVLIRRAQRGALRVERRIVLISLNQRPFERVGASWRDPTDGAAAVNSIGQHP